jgi:DNA-binding protein WhiA
MVSFSAKAKNESCRVPLRRECCKLSELAALIHTAGTIQLRGKEKINFHISTENASIARRAFLLFKELYHINTEVLVRKNRRLRKNNNYILVVPQAFQPQRILKDTYILHKDQHGNVGFYDSISPDLIQRNCCKKAYLRGAFLGGGSVSDPEKTYHLEFVAHNGRYAESLCDLMNTLNLHAKVIERKSHFVVYLKEGEHIVNLLSLIGAHTALLNLENIRIYKDIRNNINRIVNCETANLSKTVNAALRQIENIKYLRDHLGLHKLPAPLREVAELRLEHNDASLKELGEMLVPPVGKSGINHRLRKLDKLAEDLKMRRG